MAKFKYLNGVRIEMTPQEEADFDASLVVPLVEYKNRKLNDLKELRKQKLASDFTVGQKVVQLTEEFRAELRELMDFSEANPGASIKVFLPSGEAVQATRAQLLAVRSSLADRVKTINDTAATHAAAILAATDNSEVDAVDLTQGWPV